MSRRLILTEVKCILGKGAGLAQVTEMRNNMAKFTNACSRENG